MIQSIDYCFAAILDYDIFSVGFFHTDKNIVDNILYLLVSAVIGSYYRKSGVSADYFAHRIAAQFTAVASAAEHRDYSLGRIFCKRVKQILHREFVVGKIYNNTVINRPGHDFHSSSHACLAQPLLDNRVGDTFSPCYGYRGKSVVHGEFTGQAKIQRMLSFVVTAGKAGYQTVIARNEAHVLGVYICVRPESVCLNF